jgi:hypothetical protein
MNKIRKQVFSDLDHIFDVINPIIDNLSPNLGYEERLYCAKEVYKFNIYLLKDDETIIETFNLLFNVNGKNSKKSN